MLIFRSEEHVLRWCKTWGQEPGAVFSLETGWKLAQAWYHDRLEPDSRRKTPDEIKILWQELGFTGEFWELGT